MAIRTCLIALLLAGLAAPALVADDRPPTQLHLVGDHWTAWDPPTTFPEGAQIHIVVAGDTLWDLAAKNLGNPYLWPQIWEKNQYVLDSHWIYPGDPLVLGVEVAGAEEAGATLAEGEEGEGMGEEGGGELEDAGRGRSNVPVPLGAESDIYCTGYVGEIEESFGWAIVGSEYDALNPTTTDGSVVGNSDGFFVRPGTVKYKLSLGDIVSLDGGRAAGLAPGLVLEAVDAGRKLRHPVSGDVIGRVYDRRGRVRVLSVQDDGAIAEIVQTCDGLRVGSQLRAFEAEPVPLARRTVLRPVNDPTLEDLTEAPVILTGATDLVSLGQDHVVYIDRGAEDDVYPGDLFTIYRLNREGRPPIVLGELAVLSSRNRTAVAKILESRYPIYAGDRLERK
ncbi:MAG TPA: LysM peptidoglycan-binding domain-containing protein [Thermoanaerobaculia bacterium]|nr:LysM peptidoglycan-binding domain-containing protein [Thermoanaerobaculia bacterium]